VFGRLETGGQSYDEAIGGDAITCILMSFLLGFRLGVVLLAQQKYGRCFR